MLARVLLMAALPALFVVSPAAAASPAPSPTPCPSATAAPGNPGTITGTIRCVDYQGGNAAVTIAAGNALTTVLVTPGTLIQGAPAPRTSSAIVGGSAYRGITDLRAGTPVQVYTTLAGGKLTATILILQK